MGITSKSFAEMQKSQVLSLATGYEEIACLGFVQNEEQILSCSWSNGCISLFDLETKTCLQQFIGATSKKKRKEHY